MKKIKTLVCYIIKAKNTLISTYQVNGTNGITVSNDDVNKVSNISLTQMNATSIKGNKGEAKYFEFEFDKRTNIDGKGKITFE